MKPRTAIQHIERHGALLVYPIKNKKTPLSLWSCFFPRSEMRWEWDSGGDNRVAKLWQLREELSRSKRVVYAKWFQNRATFFSRDAFTAFLAFMNATAPPITSPEAKRLLSVLRDNSPLSTKQLKRASELEGRFFESAFHKGLGELWSRLLIIGYGEVDDGAFPSLLMGATDLMFEELVLSASKCSKARARGLLAKLPVQTSPFVEYIERLEKRWNRESQAERLRLSRIAGSVAWRAP